jgi:hypothetical protein
LAPLKHLKNPVKTPYFTAKKSIEITTFFQSTAKKKQLCDHREDHRDKHFGNYLLHFIKYGINKGG